MKIGGKRLSCLMGGPFHTRVRSNPHCSNKWVVFNAKCLRKRIRMCGKIDISTITEYDYQGKYKTKHKNIF